MKVKKTRYLIPLLILTIIITFCSFSCSSSSPGNQTIEEPAQKTAEEITAEEPEDEPAEEVVADESVGEDDNNGNTEIEYEIIYTLNLRYDDGITYYILINSIDLSDDTFKDNIKEIIRKIVEEKGKKISIEIFDKRDSLQNGYEYDAEDSGEWVEQNAEEREEWKAWITNEEILNDLAIHCIASYDGELDTGLYYNTLWFFIYSDSDNAENPEIDNYVETIEFNPSETKEETTETTKETTPVIEDENATIEAENRYLSETSGIAKGIKAVYEDFQNSIKDYNKGFLTLEGFKVDSIEFYAGTYAAVYAFDSLEAPVPESLSVYNQYFSKFILEWQKNADHVKNFIKSTSNKDMQSELKAAFDCVKAANGYMEAANAELNKLKQ